jgi:ABC-type antimicrobial peptide transport system permease subunit
MKKFISMFLRHWRKSPVKISLTVLSVALGTGILVISFSAGSIIKDRVASGMTKNGNVLYVSNATWNTNGSLETVRPGEWDTDAPSKLAAESGAVSAGAIVTNTPFNQVSVNGSSYRLRASVGTSAEYFDVFSLKLVAGDSMTAQDLAQGSKKVWISEQLAAILFGSAADAIGKQVQPPGRLFRRGPEGETSQNLIVYYTVTGVFATPPEVARRSYGIADLVFPYTAMIPPGMNATFEKRMMAETFVVKTSVASQKKAEAAIRQVLTADYPKSDGKDLSIAVWEGSSRGVSTYLQQLRQAISIFTVSVNILGLVLLVISSMGIFSVMVVELLSRRRDIALERAIGASQADVVKEFWTWSVALSLFGALLGVLIAIPLSGPVLRTIAPLLGEVSTQFSAAATLTPSSIALGLLLALGCGGVLGALPAFAAVKGNISDTLREV